MPFRLSFWYRSHLNGLAFGFVSLFRYLSGECVCVCDTDDGDVDDDLAVAYAHAHSNPSRYNNKINDEINSPTE